MSVFTVLNLHRGPKLATPLASNIPCSVCSLCSVWCHYYIRVCLHYGKVWCIVVDKVIK